MAKSEAAAVKDPATKGKLKMIILIVVALLLAIGVSVGATWYFMHSAQSKPAAAAVCPFSQPYGAGEASGRMGRRPVADAAGPDTG